MEVAVDREMEEEAGEDQGRVAYVIHHQRPFDALHFSAAAQLPSVPFARCRFSFCCRLSPLLSLSLLFLFAFFKQFLSFPCRRPGPSLTEEIS